MILHHNGNASVFPLAGSNCSHPYAVIITIGVDYS